MKAITCLLLSFLTFSIFSQQLNFGTKWAVVVGVSDYQYEEIPDLEYAHKDAEAFSAFLRTEAGGNIPEENIKLLTEEKATNGQFIIALDWLLDVSREGDEVLIYFSGHGDVEKKLLNQPGYLLLWDSPPRSYMLGAMSIYNLQQVISTLSLVNKAKVIIVSDACRSGKLAGSDQNGPQITNANLSKQFANEIKILSCQPDEFSVEGKEWGGGRGAFSYHLVDGLYGLADNNSDSEVNLLEIGRYLEDHVTPQVAPISQNPMTLGNKTEKISIVNEELLASRKKQTPSLSQIGKKGFDDEILANVDTAVVELYHAFQKTLENKQFFSPANTCADTLYAQLSTIEELKPLQNYMRRNYAAALQDDAQQMINRMVIEPEKEMRTWYSPRNCKRVYGPYPRMLERAAELLGKDHYMYNILQARKYFIEGGIQSLQSFIWGYSKNGALALEKFRQSLKWQPDAAHTYLWMGMNFGENLKNPDSSNHYLDKAIDLSPTWLLPYYWKVIFYSKRREFDKAKTILDKITTLDSTNVIVHNSWGKWYIWQSRYEESLNAYNKALSFDSSSLTAKMYRMWALGFLDKEEEAIREFNEVMKQDTTIPVPYYHMGQMFYRKRDYKKAIHYLSSTLRTNSAFLPAFSLLGDALIQEKRFDEAEQVLKKGYNVDSTYMPLLNALGGVYFSKKIYDKAEFYYKKAIVEDDAFMEPYYNLACVYSLTLQIENSLTYLESAIERGMKFYNYMQKDEYLKNLRERSEFQDLMKKYFQDKVK